VRLIERKIERIRQGKIYTDF